MAPGSRYQIDMCHGPLFSKVLLFSIPLMISNVMQVLFNAIDLAVIGRFASSDSMAAVGTCGPLITLFLSFFFGLSAGTNVVVARCIGARNKKQTSQAVHTAVALAVAGGLLLAAGGVWASRSILTLMGTPAHVLPKAVLYIQLYCVGAPLVLVYNYGAAVLRATGDTRRPMIFLLISGVIKVIVNLILVSCFDMDVAGVSVATIVANIIAAVLVIGALTGARDSSRLFLNKVRFHSRSFGEILKIGVPAGIQSSLFGLSNVVIQSAVNSFGSDAMAGNAAGISLEGIVYVAGNAFYFATISFVGQNCGAGKYKRLLKSFIYCLICAAATATILGWSICFAGRPLLYLYNPDPVVIEWGMLRLKYLLIPYMLCSSMDIFSGGLRGLGHSFKPMFVTLMGACAFRVAWVWWVLPLHRSMETLFISYPVSWVLVTGVNGLIFYVVLRRLFDQAAHHVPKGSAPPRPLMGKASR